MKNQFYFIKSKKKQFGTVTLGCERAVTKNDQTSGAVQIPDNI